MALFTRRNHDEAGSEGAGEATPRPGTIGALLREAREQHGASIEQIGIALRIRPAFLEAIEENRYDRLPGTAYALGFVRSYADHLGLDGEALGRRFKEEVGGVQSKRDLYFPVPLTDNSLPGGTLLAIALLFAAAAYLFWYFQGSGNHARPERVAEVPPQIIPLPPPAPGIPSNEPGQATAPAAEGGAASGLPPAADGSAPQPAPQAPPQAGQPTQNQPAAPVGVPPAATTAGAPAGAAAPASPATQSTAGAAPGNAPASNAPGASAPATNPPAGGAAPAGPPQGARVFGAVDAASRITLTAKSDSWIQVRAPDQSVVSMRVLKAGDSYRVPDRTDLMLVTGNAGGLDVTVDGRGAPPVGPAGKRRVVALDPDKLLAGNATQQ